MTAQKTGIANHALLFAFFARETLPQPDGEKAILRAVERYGLERGGRMAKRARKDGMPLTVGNYLLYGEWAAAPGESALSVPEFEPEVNLQNHCCAWDHTWKERGMIPYGKLYCTAVDAALARGYDPELNLELTMFTPGGGEYCNFYFRDRPMNAEEQGKLARNREKLGARAKKDWDYHTGHLYSALARTLRDELGEQSAAAIEERATQAYEQEFGREALDVLRAARDLDYDSVADYPETEGLEK